jgi:hypothetical protein
MSLTKSHFEDYLSEQAMENERFHNIDSIDEEARFHASFIASAPAPMGAAVLPDEVSQIDWPGSGRTKAAALFCSSDIAVAVADLSLDQRGDLAVEGDSALLMAIVWDLAKEVLQGRQQVDEARAWALRELQTQKAAA